MASAVVAYYNSGSLGWVKGRMGEVAYLGTWDPEPGQDRASQVGGDGTNGSPATDWPRYNRIAMQPADYVGPGQIAWFQFTIRAPATPGTYRLALRPLIEGATWMEDYGVFWVFNVLSSGDVATVPAPTPTPSASPSAAPAGPSASPAPGPAPSGLVAAYSFNEGSGTTVTDASGRGHGGALSDATWTAAGKYGNALSFNGTNAYVNLSNPSDFQLGGSMTVSAWVLATANPPDDGQIIAKSSGAGWQLKTSPDTGPHTFGLAVSGGGANTQRYSATVRQLNTWYYVAGVYDASAQTLNLFVNGVLNSGVLVGGVPASQLNNAAENVTIGRRTGGFYFQGTIDEVRIYNRALAPSEIQADMSTPIYGLAPIADTQSPTVPGTAGASVLSNSRIDVSWSAATDNVGVTSYLVERCSGVGCTGFTQIGSTPSTGFIDSSVVAATTYQYRVRASDAAANLSGYSNVTSATTPTAGSGPPGMLIPADRLTSWNPGIPGGVPVRTTVCASVNAAAYSNGVQDATVAIQAALDACPVGQVVQLSAGDFKITNTLLISKGIVLRGMGPTQTKLKMPVGTNSNLITVGSTQFFKFTQTTNLATDAVKGSRSVSLTGVPAGLAAGEIVAVDELTDPNISEWSTKSPPGDVSRTWFTRPNRPLGQIMEVQSVSGNTVTFTTPFHISFQTAFVAQLSRFSDATNGAVVPAVKFAGIEDLYVYGGSQGQGNISLANAAYSWIRNIESDFQDGPSVAIDASFRSVLRDSYIHSTQTPQPGGGGYGISFSVYSADNLVENNIVWNMNKVMVMRASGGGNVIGYNYMEDGWISYNPAWVEVGLNASHMTTPHYELFEGNESFNFDADNTWGNAVYVTVFRNHLTGKRRSIAPLSVTDVQNRRAVGLMEGHWWYSFVGNVLGYSGMSPAPFSAFTYEQTTAPPPWTDDPTALWRLGYNPENWNAAADPKVLATVIREGNFDYATNSVHWSAGATTIPDSLYLTSKPAFFGSSAWPWVDPTGATKVQTLPARARFDAMPTH